MSSIFAVVIMVGLLAFTAYQVTSLVRVIREKRKAKSEHKEKSD